jgi:N-carbamoyl-L-amino-acid hydrolase
MPGAPNVIPGKVRMSLEIRDLDSAKMQQVFDRVEAEAKRIASERNTQISFHELDVAIKPAPTDPRVRDLIAKAAQSLDLTQQRMPSGAGHDAQHIAQIAPAGMIFVPSVGGISHAPKEYTSPEDMANGVNVLLRTTLALDSNDR